MRRLRRSAAPVLVGLGVFLIVAAGLVRFYAYPTLAKVPDNYKGETFLEAEGARILNFETYETEVHDLEITSGTRQDVDADTADGDVVWVNVVTAEVEGWTEPFQQSTERAAFDEVSGGGVECDDCDTWIEVKEGEETVREPVTFEGQVYKFPFDTQKKTYEVWDGSLRDTAPATYEGTEEIQGLTVYKFVQEILPTVIETREAPGSMFGSEEGTVDAEMTYAMTRTFYIEPVTGSPVQRVEERTQQLNYDGQAVDVFTGTVNFTDGEVDATVSDLEGQAPLLGGMRFLFPLGFLVVGVLALAAGLFLGRRAEDGKQHEAPADRPLVNA